MRKLVGGVTIVMVLVGVLALRTHGQAGAPPTGAAPNVRMQMEPGQRGPFNFMLPPPMTRLEAFAAQRGVVVVKGLSDTGALRDDISTTVSVAAVQMSNGTDKVVGAAITMATMTAYVDEEELEGLINAIDSIAKLQDGVTPLQHFEARYQTGGAVEIANVRLDSGGRAAVLRIMQLNVTTGQPEFGIAQFTVSRLPELGQRLRDVKDTLARIKSAPAPAESK
jgi:hypothetical protein